VAEHLRGQRARALALRPSRRPADDRQRRGGDRQYRLDLRDDRQPPQWQPAYNASKAAVHQLTKSLAAEWAPHNIRVNALAPGYVKTAMAPVDEPQFRRHWIEDAPMQRYALPEELGPSLVYLASEASGFMTGSVLVVDGGYTLW
jgi:NAD(P)-dependent dehydrogenase (short-subunit alcohol dehydrogenase family)